MKPQKLLPLTLLALAGAAAPPPMDSYCTPGPFVIFFDAGSRAIDTRSTATLANMIDNLNACGAAVNRVEIDGYTDRSEAADLSSARARTVQRYLQGYGIKLPLLPLGHGATSLKVETGAGAGERQNRRVEITFWRSKGVLAADTTRPSRRGLQG